MDMHCVEMSTTNTPSNSSDFDARTELEKASSARASGNYDIPDLTAGSNGGDSSIAIAMQQKPTDGQYKCLMVDSICQPNTYTSLDLADNEKDAEKERGEINVENFNCDVDECEHEVSARDYAKPDDLRSTFRLRKTTSKKLLTLPVPGRHGDLLPTAIITGDCGFADISATQQSTSAYCDLLSVNTQLKPSGRTVWEPGKTRSDYQHAQRMYRDTSSSSTEGVNKNAQSVPVILVTHRHAALLAVGLSILFLITICSVILATIVLTKASSLPTTDQPQKEVQKVPIVAMESKKNNTRGKFQCGFTGPEVQVEHTVTNDLPGNG